jgi:uncharacterized membrane protein YhaH (DUF805 family)
MDIPNLLFSYEGRIGRMTYFWGTFALCILQFAIFALVIRRGIGVEHLLTAKALPPLALYLLVFGWMNGALSAKRFHDIGQSGWMTLVVFGGMGIPIIGFYCFWLYMSLFFRAGDTWSNIYGPPLGGATLTTGGLGGDSGEPCHAKAFAAIDELARTAATGGAASVPTVALEAPARRSLPGAAPLKALPPPSGFGRRNAAFGRR